MMGIKFHKQQRSVVYNWILSYLLLVLIMVVLTGVVYIITRKTVETEINSSNILLLENIRDTIDHSLAEINDFSMEILSLTEIGEVNALLEGDRSYYYKIYKAAQSLNSFKSFKNEFQNFYIYFGSIDKVMRPGVLNSSFLYYTNFVRSNDFSYRQWKETVNRIYYGEYVPLPLRNPISGENSGLAFIRSIPFPSRFYSDVTNIVIMTNFDKILSRNGKDRDIAVLDNNNHIIIQSRPDMLLNTDGIQNISGEHGRFTRDINGRKEIISHIASREYGWKYITVTPENVFWEKSFFIRLIIWGEILLGIAGMGLLSFYFVRRNYNVLYEITSFIRLKMHSETLYGGNEFHFIRQVLTQSIEEKEAAESQRDQYIAVLRSNFLINLIEGNKVPLDELMPLYRISFPHPYYSVAAVYINSLIPNYGTAAVTKRMEAILNRNNASYCMEFCGYIVCVVNTPFTCQEFRRVMEDDLKDAHEIISNDFDIDISISVSSLYSSLENISRAYSEAQSSVDYIRIMGNRKIVFFEDINNLDSGVVIYPFKKERILLNHLRLSHFEAVREVLDDIFLTDLLKPSVSYGMAHFVVMAMAAQLLRNICADEEETNRLFNDKNTSIEHLNRCKSIIEMKTVMFRLLKESANQENSGTGRKRQFSIMIQDYILKHYSDPLLSLESIADVVGRSPNYISKKFKMETGGTIPDFINKTRIEKAKILLLNPMPTEAQIAEWVGFTSIRTYQRVFKQMEGVTHSQFKQGDSQTNGV